jgi:hypothetical protein
VAGAGNGISSPATYNTVLDAVPTARAGMESPLNDTDHQLGLAVGVVALGVVALGSLLSSSYRTGLPAHRPANATGSLATTLAYASHAARDATLTAASGVARGRRERSFWLPRAHSRGSPIAALGTLGRRRPPIAPRPSGRALDHRGGDERRETGDHVQVIEEQFEHAEVLAGRMRGDHRLDRP